MFACGLDAIGQLCILSQKFWFETAVHAEHVGTHQHLTVDSAAGADAYHGDFNFRGHAPGQLRGYLFKHEGEASEAFNQPGVGEQLFSLGLLFSTDAVAAEFVNALRCQS